ncbi:MAG: hypothetical protein Q9202_002679 [Teloschistes flavicans]
MEPSIDKILVVWLERLKNDWGSGPGPSRDFDIAQKIQFLTVDIITQLCLVPLFRRLLVHSECDEGGIGKVLGVIKQTIDRRIAAESPSQNDMLASFLDRGLSSTQARTELVMALVAGSGTASTSIQATLLSIITNPGVYSRLRNEIDYAIAHGNISVPIRDTEAHQLPYLQACVLEGLRTHPPLAQLRDRVAPPEGDYILGHRVPGGTWVGLNSWGTQRDAVYGDDPDIFRPERWLVDDVSKLKQMKRTCDLVFGYGPTRCLGVGIARMELNKVIFEVSFCSMHSLKSSQMYSMLEDRDLFAVSELANHANWKQPATAAL